ncbi:MAG: hypothetical protein AAFU85_30360, partial [Planctomycetota bacterium]
DPPGAVALELGSGNTVWRSTSFRSSHTSPLLITVDRESIVCIHGMFDLIGLQSKSGSVLFRHRLRDIAADNVAFTPVWDFTRQQLIVSHGYCEIGTQAIGLVKESGAWKTTLNWSNRAMRLVYTNAVIASETLVGVTGNAGVFVGLSCRDGHTVFRTRGPKKSNLLRVDDSVLILEDRGLLRFGAISKDGYTERWKLDTAGQDSWTVPTWTDRGLLIRAESSVRLFSFDD